MPRIVLFLAICQTLLAADDPAHFTLQGTVVNSVTGEPIRRAAVTLQSMGSQSQNANLSADAGGRFIVPELPPGAYTISVQKQGFAPARPVTVQLTADMDDVSIPLLPLGRITGKVMDDVGDPILRADVQLFRATIQMGRRVMQPAGSALTNDLGEFHVASLPPGRYYVSATAQPEPDGTAYARTFYGGAADLSSASPLELRAGGNERAELRMQPVSSYAVRGTIVNLPEGLHPYLNITRRGSVLAANEAHATQIDASTGAFEFRGITPGDWVVAAGCFERNSQLFGTAEVVVSSADIEGLTVPLGKATELTGKVKLETGAEGANLHAVYISIRPVKDGSQPAMGAQMSDDGTFSLAGVQPGDYVVVARPQQPLYVKSITLGGRDITTESFTVHPGAEDGPMEITLGKGGGELVGTVVDGTTPARTGVVLLVGHGPERFAALDSTGKFGFSGLPPGDYTAYAFGNVDDVEYSNPDVMQRFSSQRISVTEGARQQTELKLNRTVY